MSKQSAQQLRAALKAAGYTSRDVSVRTDGTSLQVTIRRVGVPFELVEQLGRKFRQVEYCHASGEALAGGSYVFVEIDWRLSMDLAKPYYAQLEAMPVDSWATIGGQEVKRESAYDFRVNRDRCVLCLGLAEHIAKLAHFGNSPTPQEKTSLGA